MVNHPVPGSVNGPLHHIFQLPDIAMPWIIFQVFHGLTAEFGDMIPTKLIGHAHGKVPGQQGHIPLSFPQGGHKQYLKGEAIQQIFFKSALPGHGGKISIGGADNADIHLQGCGTTHPLKLAIFHHP